MSFEYLRLIVRKLERYNITWNRFRGYEAKVATLIKELKDLLNSEKESEALNIAHDLIVACAKAGVSNPLYANFLHELARVLHAESEEIFQKMILETYPLVKEEKSGFKIDFYHEQQAVTTILNEKVFGSSVSIEQAMVNFAFIKAKLNIVKANKRKDQGLNSDEFLTQLLRCSANDARLLPLVGMYFMDYAKNVIDLMSQLERIKGVPKMAFCVEATIAAVREKQFAAKDMPISQDEIENIIATQFYLHKVKNPLRKTVTLSDQVPPVFLRVTAEPKINLNSYRFFRPQPLKKVSMAQLKKRPGEPEVGLHAEPPVMESKPDMGRKPSQ